MSTHENPLGRITWTDLAVPDAQANKAFYEAVVGWTSDPLDMGGYDDYCMKPAGSDDVVAGICHARGDNADIPPVWLVYINVPDIEASVRQVVALKGSVLRPIREAGGGKMSIVRDPAGAIFALYQAAATT
ncbi:MAG TPA: VOC family protein [Candidatus Limnocylindria bacterium]|jgi:predicted enzyme related to lactoylglutathione lyase|nr:VOC family protein [Candidatus Limnocylindria bacterium]